MEDTTFIAYNSKKTDNVCIAIQYTGYNTQATIHRHQYYVGLFHSNCNELRGLFQNSSILVVVYYYTSDLHNEEMLSTLKSYVCKLCWHCWAMPTGGGQWGGGEGGAC